ncbi:DUF2637 domain-containing protein [Streptomyces aurantiacus]|uniref:DUF2637 domain-containing protein n=1 Tax=Streptomyces aurantiacus JA 4570 TaxID=1286094 RepID=S3ZBB2_9ACTN|nr:DUF2637 domain-containing protein [Streptomyces aurantiacus]EPH39899.1 hypothetical protein STRAU_7105 [Streptomyces aurantiacus JA 4570]
MLESLAPAQIQSAERTLAAGTWAITGGAVLYSVLTVTPLVERVTPAEWQWTAPILPLVVDAAVVIVVRLDAVVARLGGSGGRWPSVLRWMTGLMTLLLNIGDSALKQDLVGVAVHAVAPLLLIVTAEAGLAYRRAIGRALERIERSRAEEQAAREQREQQARERDRQEREHAEQAAREHAERVDRERFEREQEQRRETREHEARMERERLAREADMRREQREHEDRVRCEQQEREDARRREQQALAERSRREQPADRSGELSLPGVPARDVVNAPARLVNTAASGVNSVAGAFTKMPESEARAYIGSFRPGERTVRQLADDTGWSLGWVSSRLQEQRSQATAGVDASLAEAVA